MGMDIRFDPKAAQDTCDELTECSAELVRCNNIIDQAKDGIRNVWSGTLAANIQGLINGKNEALNQISAFVTGVNNQIATSRRNYLIAEGQNVETMEQIVDMFL